MRYFVTSKFALQYRGLPPNIQKKFDKQLVYLLESLAHPSLRAKKYDEGCDIWQARVDRKYRFFFLVEGDYYVLLTIGSHPK